MARADSAPSRDSPAATASAGRKPLVTLAGEPKCP